MTAEPGYVWRDPARVGPRRLAELQARDRHLALLDAPAPQRGQAEADDRKAQFAALRRNGTSITACAGLLGVTRNTAQRYERARLREEKR